MVSTESFFSYKCLQFQFLINFHKNKKKTDKTEKVTLTFGPYIIEN